MKDGEQYGQDCYMEIYDILRESCSTPHKTAQRIAILTLDRERDGEESEFWENAKQRVLTMP